MIQRSRHHAAKIAVSLFSALGIVVSACALQGDDFGTTVRGLEWAADEFTEVTDEADRPDDPSNGPFTNVETKGGRTYFTTASGERYSRLARWKYGQQIRETERFYWVKVPQAATPCDDCGVDDGKPTCVPISVSVTQAQLQGLTSSEASQVGGTISTTHGFKIFDIGAKAEIKQGFTKSWNWFRSTTQLQGLTVGYPLQACCDCTKQFHEVILKIHEIHKWKQQLKSSYFWKHPTEPGPDTCGTCAAAAEAGENPPVHLHNGEQAYLDRMEFAQPDVKHHTRSWKHLGTTRYAYYAVMPVGTSTDCCTGATTPPGGTTPGGTTPGGTTPGGTTSGGSDPGALDAGVPSNGDQSQHSITPGGDWDNIGPDGLAPVPPSGASRCRGPAGDIDNNGVEGAALLGIFGLEPPSTVEHRMCEDTDVSGWDGTGPYPCEPPTVEDDPEPPLPPSDVMSWPGESAIEFDGEDAVESPEPDDSWFTLAAPKGPAVPVERLLGQDTGEDSQYTVAAEHRVYGQSGTTPYLWNGDVVGTAPPGSEVLLKVATADTAWIYTAHADPTGVIGFATGVLGGSAVQFVEALVPNGTPDVSINLEVRDGPENICETE